MKALILLLSAVVLLMAPVANAQPWLWCWNADYVYATVDGSTVSVFHDGSMYNCGLEGFEFSVVPEGSVIHVVETPVIHFWAACNCCFDASVDIENVPPGSHVIDYYYADVDSQGQHVYLEVVVPDVGQGGAPAIGNQTSTGCLQNDPGAVESGDPENGATRISRGHLSLYSAYPNPALSSFRLQYGLEKEMPVTLSVYSAGGSWICDLHQGPRQPGTYTQVWDGRDWYGRRVPAGLYFCRLSGGGYAITRPLILLH